MDRLLDTYIGYLQIDDYQAFHAIKAHDGGIGLACWTHARRNFENALDCDRERASTVTKLIQQLYTIEREARDGGTLL